MWAFLFIVCLCQGINQAEPVGEDRYIERFILIGTASCDDGVWPANPKSIGQPFRREGDQDRTALAQVTCWLTGGLCSRGEHSSPDFKAFQLFHSGPQWSSRIIP